MKNGKFTKLMLLLLVTFSMKMSLHGQAEFCCIAPLIIPHRLSYQYGLINHKSIKQGWYQGAEFVLFYDKVTYRHFGYGLKMSYGKKHFDDSEENILGGAIELDLHIRDQNNWKKGLYFNPYIGLENGLSGGYLANNHNKAKYTLSPIIGFQLQFAHNVMLNANTKYQLVFEKGISHVMMFSAGIQWDFLDLVTGVE